MSGVGCAGVLLLVGLGAIACGDTGANGNGGPSTGSTDSAATATTSMVTTGAGGTGITTSAGASTSTGSDSSGSGGTAGAGCGPTPAPGTVLEGDLVLSTPGDVAAAQAYAEVTGNLEVSPGLQVLELPNLVAIGGDIRFESLSLVTLFLPNLRTLGGELWLYLNMELLEADFRNLERVGESIYIHRNIALRSIQLFSLESIGGVPVSDPTPIEFSAQLALPTCFEDRLIEMIPQLETQLIGSQVECTCTLECDLLVADC